MVEAPRRPGHRRVGGMVVLAAHGRRTCTCRDLCGHMHMSHVTCSRYSEVKGDQVCYVARARTVPYRTVPYRTVRCAWPCAGRCVPPEARALARDRTSSAQDIASFEALHSARTRDREARPVQPRLTLPPKYGLLPAVSDSPGGTASTITREQSLCRGTHLAPREQNQPEAESRRCPCTACH